MANLGVQIFGYGIIGLAITALLLLAYFAYSSHKWGNRKQ